MKELISDGVEVIFVSSGAVGVGRQKLRLRRMMNSRFRAIKPLKFLHLIAVSINVMIWILQDRSTNYWDYFDFHLVSGLTILTSMKKCMQFSRFAETSAGTRWEAVCSSGSEWANGSV